MKGMFGRFGRWIKRKMLDFVGFQTVNGITINKGIIEDICEMARSAHPKEMLAFLSSTKGVRGGILHIDEIQLQAYDASSHSAYVNLMQLPSFTSIIGTVHSHPSSNTRPSDADLGFWSRYGLVHGIIGYPYRPGSISWYDKEGNRIGISVVDAR